MYMFVNKELTADNNSIPEQNTSNVEPSSLKHFRIMKRKKTIPDVFSLIMGDLANKDIGSSEQCRVCGKLFDYNDGKKGHICSITCLYRCSTCGKTFHSSQDLKHHAAEHEGLNTRTKTIVQETKKPERFTNTYLLKKTYKCHFCFESFPLKWQLTSHLSVHSNLKEYKCDVCTKSFDRKRTLNDHIITHTNGKG